ncbi:uncharacterized protein wu:fi75a02 isoform X1 [Syngnathus typhle]|uniref:uncharacterized protein wu:fi75a02 isoform X1 n=1 Tax=Syngnathus typhle TaxID=161592 RepID=UPI002A69EF13|nr:uncharacterized protein wu:fi75a02 isoform X1 [Syngnathus typhle]
MLALPPPEVTPPAPPSADNNVYGAPQAIAPQGRQRRQPGPRPSCPCAALLPRLLATHRMEVRRLLRGALASLARRVDALERTAGGGRRKSPERRAVPRADCRRGPAPFPRPPSSSVAPESSPPLCPRDGESRVEGRGVKRRRNHRGGEGDRRLGRFVGRLAVRPAGDGAPDRATLTLLNLEPGSPEQGGQSLKGVSLVLGRNGYSFCPFDLLRSTSGRWTACRRSSGSTPPPPLLPCSAASLLRLSATALATLGGGTHWNLWRPLSDWTAPPSLAVDHCYIQEADLRAPEADRRADSRKRLLAPPLPPCAEAVASPPLPVAQSASGCKQKAGRVSRIRISRAAPREIPLTPMGLPKVKRLNKKEFSVEEIYTNKNYKCPANNRTLETIFEEPREKDGALLLIGQQRRRRLLLFPDFTQPRKRKRAQGVGLPVAVPRKRVVRRQYRAGRSVDDQSDLDVMLVQRLSALEDFLTAQGLDV